MHNKDWLEQAQDAMRERTTQVTPTSDDPNGFVVVEIPPMCHCGRKNVGKKHCPACGSTNTRGKASRCVYDKRNRLVARGYRCQSCAFEFNDATYCNAPLLTEQPKSARQIEREAYAKRLQRRESEAQRATDTKFGFKLEYGVDMNGEHYTKEQMHEWFPKGQENAAVMFALQREETSLAALRAKGLIPTATPQQENTNVTQNVPEGQRAVLSANDGNNPSVPSSGQPSSVAGRTSSLSDAGNAEVADASVGTDDDFLAAENDEFLKEQEKLRNKQS